MKIAKPFVLAIVLAMFACGPVLAASQQEEPADLPPKKADIKREWFGEPAASRGDTTSAALLQQLQATRPFNALISSKRSRELHAKGMPKPLLPEGTRLIERIGSIRQEGDWWLFLPTGDDSHDDAGHKAGHEEAMRILPSEWLEVMIRSSVGSAQPLLFSLSGEVTEFDGSNYVLARSVSRVAIQQDMQTPTPAVAEVATDAPIDDVVARLRKIKLEIELLSPPELTVPSMPKFVAPALPFVRPEGTPMVRRPGRLIEESPWWMFVLETSSKNQGQLPLKLLPNRNVELMIENISRGAEGVVFLVSGQLTLYNGENYLHVQAVTRQVDIGNLRK